jgi:hypothetical protein
VPNPHLRIGVLSERDSFDLQTEAGLVDAIQTSWSLRASLPPQLKVRVDRTVVTGIV